MLPRSVPHHGFVDLDLVLAADLAVVRLEPRGVCVVVVAANKTGRCDLTGAEHELIVAIANRHMEPGAA